MKRLVAFFEIPAINFERAIQFYESVFNLTLNAMDFGQEKMAFFPKETGKCTGAISYAPNFKPSKDGVLISFSVENIENTLNNIERSGGEIVISKTKIEAENNGYFAVFTDSEGNKLGLYSDK